MVQAAVVLDIHYTFVKYFSKAMATFSPNKKNTEKEMEKKNVCTKMMLEKKMFAEEHFSYPPPEK